MNLEHARKLLLAARQDREDRLERTQKHLQGRQEALSPNFHEQAIETANDEVVQRLDEDAREELLQIEQALRRIDDGDYFWCKACGGPIGMERLVAIPWTQSCIKCASSMPAGS